jgi:hypothetical protein
VGQASLPVDDARASFARATSAHGRTLPSQTAPLAHGESDLFCHSRGGAKLASRGLDRQGRLSHYFQNQEFIVPDYDVPDPILNSPHDEPSEHWNIEEQGSPPREEGAQAVEH